MNQKRLNRKDGSFWTLSPERCARGFSFCADWSAYKHPARLSTGKWVVSFGWESHKGSGSVRLRIGRRFFSGGVRQDTRRPKRTVPFERLGLRLSDFEVLFCAAFQPTCRSLIWLGVASAAVFLRELTARYAPNARFASFGRDNRDYMARIARDARPRLGFASQTRTFGAYLAFDSRNDAHSARFLPYSRRFPDKRQEARALCVDLASTECGKIGTGGVSCLGSAFASPAKDSDGAFSRLA